MIKLALIDSNQLFLASLKAYLNSDDRFKVVYSSTSFELEEESIIPNFDILVFDLINQEEQMAYFAFRAHYLPKKNILLSNRERAIENNLLVKIMDLNGFVLKSVEPDTFKNIVRSIGHFSSLRMILNQSLFQEIIESYNDHEKLTFTNRELIILRLIRKEKTNSQIATFLNISTRTVESHRRRMIQRTGSRNIFGVFTALEREQYFFSQDINSLRPEPFSLILN